MKIIKTALGWEIQPQDDKEESHLKWLLSALATQPQEACEINLGPQCPQCGAFGCYNGEFCKWCRYQRGTPMTTQYRTGDNASYRLRVPVE